MGEKTKFFKHKNSSSNVSVVAKATLWFLICSVIQKCTSLITIPIFTRIMSTEQVGQYTAYTTWLQVLTIITTFRLDYGVFNKGMSKYSKDQNGYVSSMLGATTMLTAFFFFIYLFFHEQINLLTGLSTFVTVAMFLELLVTPAISFWSLQQRYSFKYRMVVFVTLMITFANTVLGVAGVLVFEEKGIARIMTCIIVQVCFGICLYCVIINKNRKMINFKYYKFAFVFNIPLLPHYFSSYILEQSDKLMIQHMVGESEMGIYGVACSIAQVIKILTSSISNALIPWLYRALEEKMYVNVKKKLTSMMMIVTGVIIAFILVSSDIMKILTSKDYYESIYALPAISGSVIFIYFFSMIANIEFYYEKNKFTLYVSIVSAVLNLILNYYFILNFGYVAASYSTLISYIISSFCHALYANKLTRRLCGVEIIQISNLIFISFVVILVVVLSRILSDNYIARYLFIGIILVVVMIFRKKLLGIVKEVLLKSKEE